MRREWSEQTPQWTVIKMLPDENGNTERLKSGENVEHKVNLLTEVSFWGFFVFSLLNKINIFLFGGGGIGKTH